MEAVLASEFKAVEISAQKRKNVILESIDSIESPNFFVDIDAKGNPNTPPSAKKLRHALQSWLKSLDPDLCASVFDKTNLDSLATFDWNHDGWFVKFSAIPKKPEARGRNQRTIGAQCNGVRLVNSWEPIRDAIKDKGKRYGKLDRPMLVAVNIDSMFVDKIDAMQALFGEEEFVFYNNCPDPQMHRKPNGAWLGTSGPQYKRVSGVWIFNSMNCWNIASRQPIIYLNPWAERPIPEEFLSLRHAKTEDHTKMKWHDGRDFYDVLGLSINWPE